MRKPPDKDQATRRPVTERDIDNSNATLNSLFGNSRTKAWMSSSGSQNPVRPTPRSSQSATTPTLATSSLPPNGPNRASPYSTTPKSNPANHLQHNGIQQASNNRANLLPIVLPVSEASVIQAAAQTGITTSTLRREPAQLENIPPGVVWSGSLELSRDREFSNDSPSSTSMGFNGAAAREPLTATQTPQTQGGQTESQSRSASQSNVNLPTATSTMVDVMVPLHVDVPQGTRQRYLNHRPSPIRIIPSSPQNSVVSPQLPFPSALIAQIQPQNTNGALGNDTFRTDASNPQKRQRIQQPTMPSLRGRIPLIDAHLASVGGYQNIRADLDRPRFQLLLAACREEDAFYVVLHQIFCVWSLNGQELAGAEGLPSALVLKAGFNVLGQLIKNNTDMDTAHLTWFSRFPSPLNDLLRTSEPYRRIVRAAGIFLTQLGTEWTPLCIEFGQRGYPVLMDELVNRLRLVSSTLQNVVFTASRRNMGITDDQGGQEMESLFQRDKAEYQKDALRYNSAIPPAENEINERNMALSRQYNEIYQRVQMAQAQQRQQQTMSRRISEQATGAPVQVPVLPSNARPLPASAGALAHAPVLPSNSRQFPISAAAPQFSPAAWQQNMSQSPELSGNWSFNTPHLQPPVPRGGTSSPALMAGGGPQPNVTYSDTPNPNLMQNYPPSLPQVSQWPSQISRNNGVSTPNPNPTPHSIQQSVAAASHENNNSHQQMQMSVEAQQQRTISQQHQILSMQSGMQLQYQNTPNLNLQQQNQQIRALQQQQQQIIMQQQQQIIMQQQQLTMHTQQAAHLQRQGQTIQHRPAQHPTQPISHNANRSNSIPNRQQSSGTNGVLNNAQLVQIPHRSVSLLDANQLTPEIMQQQAQRKSHIYHTTQPLDRSLIPPHGYIHPSQPTLPDLTAAHQAHIRSPKLISIDLSHAPGLEEDSARRFYQAVKGFAMNPMKIPVSTALSKFEFAIPDASWDLIAQDKFTTTERLPSREFKRGTLQYRLRCIQTKEVATKCMIAEWSISDTVWPETVFLEVNGQHLEVRRKNHHGKDLPIDVTAIMKQKFVLENGGKNVLKVSIPRIRKSMRETFYFIAVEVIEILQHEQVMNMCTKRRIPAEKTLGDIKKSLAGPSGDDDEISIMPDDLTIDLADPFTARIFEIPVRGGSCLHRECFDLETFLLTRNAKPKRPGQPCMIDVWKCPLCGRDARPYTLQVDDFLVSVRAGLKTDNNFNGLEVKAIRITPEGKWYAKLEDKPLKRKASNGLDEDTSDDDDLPRRVVATLPPKPRSDSLIMNGANNRARSRIQAPIEVIDLDD